MLAYNVKKKKSRSDLVLEFISKEGEKETNRVIYFSPEIFSPSLVQNHDMG